MKQLKSITPVLFLTLLLFVALGCAKLRRQGGEGYCLSGVDTCLCGKPKPPGYFSSQKAVQMTDTLASSTQLSSTVTQISQATPAMPGTSIQLPGYAAPAVNKPVTTTQSYSTTKTTPTGKETTTHTSSKSSSSSESSGKLDPATTYSSKTTKTTETSKTTTESISNSSSKSSTNSDRASRNTEISAAESQSKVNKPAANSSYASEQAYSAVDTNRRTASTSTSRPALADAINRPTGRESSTPVKGCQFAPTCEVSTGVIVKARTPDVCMLTEKYSVDYDLTATSDVNNVVLTAKVSDNATYVSSQPEAKVSGKDLTWNIGQMTKGQRISGKIVMEAKKEGEICTCFNVKAAADACCSSMCAIASLACEKSGPEEVCPGDQFSYLVYVTNTGSYPARDVVLVVTDADKAMEPLSYDLGTLDAGKTKRATIPVTAINRGKIAYTALAKSSNADPVSTDLTTLVTAYSVECTKNGPKNAFIGQKAPYQIHIVNTGDRDLHDVVITEVPHSATAIASADGAAITDRAIWRIPVLKAGEKADFKVSLTTRRTGIFNNSTTVASREGYGASRETSTNWKGRAALDMSMSTSDNSIFVGETTRYKITVTNQGQEADSNVTIAAIFPEGLEPVNAAGDSQATINGRTVNFAPKNLGLRQTMEHYVTVRATKAGDLRPKVQVSSDSIKPPITQEESLIVN